jgi:hypothetical protein
LKKCPNTCKCATKLYEKLTKTQLQPLPAVKKVEVPEDELVQEQAQDLEQPAWGMPPLTVKKEACKDKPGVVCKSLKKLLAEGVNKNDVCTPDSFLSKNCCSTCGVPKKLVKAIKKLKKSGKCTDGGEFICKSMKLVFATEMTDPSDVCTKDSYELKKCPNTCKCATKLYEKLTKTQLQPLPAIKKMAAKEIAPKPLPKAKKANSPPTQPALSRESRDREYGLEVLKQLLCCVVTRVQVQ